MHNRAAFATPSFINQGPSMLRGAVNRCYEIRTEHASVVRLIQRNTMGTFRPQITVACTPVTGITLILYLFALR